MPSTTPSELISSCVPFELKAWSNRFSVLIDLDQLVTVGDGNRDHQVTGIVGARGIDDKQVARAKRAR